MRTPQDHTADEAHSFSELKAIEQALQPYLAAAKSGDGESIRPAFFENAHIVGSIDGAFYDLDLDTFIGSVTSGGPNPKVEYHIASIQVSGPAASVRVEFANWGEHRFTDFFVMYRQDGAWKIRSKVYNSHSRN